MITEQDIVNIELSKENSRLVRDMAKEAMVGGKSRITNKYRGKDALYNDQVIGQCGELALSLYLTGGVEKYREKRAQHTEEGKWQGDNGSDFPGLNVDIKASKKSTKRGPLDHHLLIRPHERIPGIVYIQGLVLFHGDLINIMLTGWECEKNLPGDVQHGGPFSGAYAVKVRELNPLPPLQWVLQ